MAKWNEYQLFLIMQILKQPITPQELQANEIEIYVQLDDQMYGRELAQKIVEKLTDNPSEGKGLYFSHRDYCGQGLFFIDNDYLLAEVYDGRIASEIWIKTSNRIQFTHWLSEQSDQSFSLITSRFNNQTITKVRLDYYLSPHYSSVWNDYCRYIQNNNYQDFHTIINQMLDKLDSIHNSNAFWIELSQFTPKTNVKKCLLQHLEAGTFHHELVVKDIERGWYHFSSICAPRDKDDIVFVQRPGTTWNGKKNIKCAALNPEQIQQRIGQLLTPPHPSEVEKNAGIQLGEQLINGLQQQFGQWQAWQLKPNFLYTYADEWQSGGIQLGYFEQADGDDVFCFDLGTTYGILLINGYKV